MKSSVYKSYDELPLFLNSDLVAKTLGIAPSSAYELMHEKDFPFFFVLILIGCTPYTFLPQTFCGVVPCRHAPLCGS